MTNMPLEGASWSLRFSKHNNLQLEICCKIMRVLPLIITHDFHGHVQEDHSGVVVHTGCLESKGYVLNCSYDLDFKL